MLSTSFNSLWPNEAIWRQNECDGVSNRQPHDCLLSRLIRRRSKKTSKLHVTGLCAGNLLETGEFHAQMASNSEYVSIWWRHHGSAGSSAGSQSEAAFENHGLLSMFLS